MRTACHNRKSKLRCAQQTRRKSDRSQRRGHAAGESEFLRSAIHFLIFGVIIVCGLSMTWGQDPKPRRDPIQFRNLEVTIPARPYERSEIETVPNMAETIVPPPPAVVSSSEIQPLTGQLKFNAPPREITLREAIELALEKSDVVRTLSSSGVQVESVTKYDPAIMQARADVSATVFDPKVTAGYLGSNINEPEGTFFGPGIPQSVVRNEANFTAALTKAWATGATTTVGYLPPLGYLFYPDGASGFNPVYTSDLVFTAQQPLLRGAGLAVNLAPIQIAQLRAEQSSWDCKQTVLAQVRSVESAYWDLQAGLISLDALESILPLMSEIVRIENLRAQQELSTAADVARVTMQFDQLQQQRLTTRSDVIGKELRLRNLLALDISDGTRLYPIERPRDVAVPLDHAAAVANAIENRPDLVRQRLGVKIRELEFLVAQNGVRPQLDLQALYRSNGIGQGLDTSLQQMAGFGYKDWTLGITYSIPIGNRAARANLRAAEFQLVRERAVLDQNIQIVSFNLADMTREAEMLFSQYTLAVRRSLNSKEWMNSARIRYSTPPPMEGGGQNWLLLALYDYQNALKMHVDAIGDAAQLLSRYNTQLARIEEAQGILLENRGIDLNNDPVATVRNYADKLYANDRPLYQASKTSGSTRPTSFSTTTQTTEQEPSNPGTQTADTKLDRGAADQASTTAEAENYRIPVANNQTINPNSIVNSAQDVRGPATEASRFPPRQSNQSQSDSPYSANYRRSLSSVATQRIRNPADHSAGSGPPQAVTDQAAVNRYNANRQNPVYNNQTINPQTAAGTWDEARDPSARTRSSPPRRPVPPESKYAADYRRSSPTAMPQEDVNPPDLESGSVIQQAVAEQSPVNRSSGVRRNPVYNAQTINPQTAAVTSDGVRGPPPPTRNSQRQFAAPASPYARNYRQFLPPAGYSDPAEGTLPDRVVSPTNYSTFRNAVTPSGR